MWADSRWIPDRGEWLEIRSTVEGLLPDDLPYATPREGEMRHPGIFNLVVDDPGKRTRSLPSFYHGAAQVYTARSVDAVVARMTRTVRLALATEREPVFLATAVRLGDVEGIYARDLFNRSEFRVALRRLGMTFSDDPYVKMLPGGRFESEDFEPFDPRFMVFGIATGDPLRGNENPRGAFAPFLFSVLRVGAMTTEDLTVVGRLFRSVPILTSKEPEELVAELGRHFPVP